jgi:hypothetical protein
MDVTSSKNFYLSGSVIKRKPVPLKLHSMFKGFSTNAFFQHTGAFGEPSNPQNLFNLGLIHPLTLTNPQNLHPNGVIDVDDSDSSE